MRSSTSSSELHDEGGGASAAPRADTHRVHRDVPARNWLAMAAVALVACAAALACWEHHVRSLGYEAGYDDTPSLWVQERQRAVGARREQLVLVGDSRTLFDLDLELLRGSGSRPIQLATVGSNPMVILEHLAADPSYAGTTLVGVVPALLAAPGGPPLAMPARYVRKYVAWSPAAAWEFALSLPLQERLAFIEPDDLTLAKLIDQLPWPRREGAFTPELPPFFADIDLARQVRITQRAEHDALLMARIQRIWLTLFAGPPRPAEFSEAAWDKMFADGWRDNLASIKRSVDAIEARGGRVFFVRHPSSGKLRELEDRITPRTTHWDRLLRETGAPGVYDRDYSELRDFACPEGSHLSARDAVAYTRRLSAILRQRGLLGGRTEAARGRASP
jgi:hypothetical protein